MRRFRNTALLVASQGLLVVAAEESAVSPLGGNVTTVVNPSQNEGISTTAAKATEGWNFSTSFEASDGFVPGFIGGNSQPVGCGGLSNPCWWTFGGPTPSQAEAHIDTVHPRSGQQHLRISRDPALPGLNIHSGPFIGAGFPHSADIVARPTGPYSMELYFSVDAYMGQDFRIQAQAPSQSNFTAAFWVSNYGGIYHLDRCDNYVEWHQWRSWPSNNQIRLRVELDPCNQVIEYFLGEGTGRTGCEVFGTAIEQIVFTGDNLPGSSLDVDDLQIVSGGPCPVFGACCDNNGFQVGCVDGQVEADCTGLDKVWTANTLCDDVECVCIPDCENRHCGFDGCGGGCGNCSDGNLCNGVETCEDGQCVPGDPPLCEDSWFCNGLEYCNPFVGCVAGTPPCSDGESCDESGDVCVPAPIPTVSDWGIVVLALALLVAAKVQFGRRRLA